MALTRILGSFKDAILTNVVSSSAQIASDISGSFLAKADKSAISGSVVGGVSGSAASTGSFGSIYVGKNVNASAFVGDGSSLTGIDIPTAAAISGAAAITSIAGTAANQLLTDDGDGTVTSEANITYDGGIFTVNDQFAIGSNKQFEELYYAVTEIDDDAGHTKDPLEAVDYTTNSAGATQEIVLLVMCKQISPNGTGRYYSRWYIHSSGQGVSEYNETQQNCAITVDSPDGGSGRYVHVQNVLGEACYWKIAVYREL